MLKMISRDTWIELIKDFHEKDLPEVIERNINIPTELPIKRVITLIGPRRSGKTYVMFQLIKHLTTKIPKERILYINFEDDRLVDANITDVRNMLNIYYEIYPENKTKKIYLFLDEIQNINKWETFVRAVMDSENTQIFISGSSSRMLSKEIATSLRGRTLTYKILPFSFREILRAKNFTQKKFFSSSDKALLINYLNEYLNFGGYPETILFPQERKRMLKEILETTIYRDVIERYNIRNTVVAKIMLKYLLTSTIFSVNKFYNYLKTSGYKISKDTLYNYFEYFCDSLVIYRLSKYSRSYKKINQSLPKIYAVSNGLNTISGISDKGRLMENLVFIELIHKGFIPDENLFYYKTTSDKEVDFVITNNGKVDKLIQSCYNINDYNTKEREIKALLKASIELNCKDLNIVTWDYEKEETINNIKINFIPLWKFLLDIK